VGVASALEQYELVGSQHDNTTLNEEATGGRSADATLEPMRLWYPPHLAHVGGCGMGVRRSLWDRLGGFDEKLPVLEDTDFCIRAQHAGFEVHVADAWVRIRFRRTLRQTFRQARAWSGTNVFLYSRYRPSGARMPNAWRDYVSRWRFALRLLSHVRSVEARQELAWQVGWQLGMLEGCLRHRVPPIPYPLTPQKPEIEGDPQGVPV